MATLRLRQGRRQASGVHYSPNGHPGVQRPPLRRSISFHQLISFTVSKFASVLAPSCRHSLWTSKNAERRGVAAESIAGNVRIVLLLCMLVAVLALTMRRLVAFRSLTDFLQRCDAATSWRISASQRRDRDSGTARLLPRGAPDVAGGVVVVAAPSSMFNGKRSAFLRLLPLYSGVG